MRRHGRCLRTNVTRSAAWEGCHDPVLELLPEYSAGYICLNEAGESYAASVSPEGVLTSLSDPVRLTPVEQWITIRARSHKRLARRVG